MTESKSKLATKKTKTLVLVVACVVSALIGGAAVYLLSDWFFTNTNLVAESDGQHGHGDEEGHDDSSETVELPKPMWQSARLKVEPVVSQTITPQTWTTGKVTLNQDRTANIYSITEGRVHRVPVSLGDQVDENQLLAVIDSREVGTAKLELLQTRLQQNFAQREHEFAKRVEQNATQLISTLDSGKSLETINDELKNKPIGKYRDQLLGAYTQFIRAKADYDRLQPIADSGAVAGKTLIQIEAEYNAAKAAFDAVLEQLRFAIPQDALQSQQALRQAEQAVDVAKAKLNILGYSDDELSELKPKEMGDELSHYEVLSPFAGRVIQREVAVSERVGTDTEMFVVSDLSSVWIQADIYQKDLIAIKRLGDSLRFRAPTGDDGSLHTHTAKIFYLGDVIDPNTRTLRLRAIAENEDRHIKPGMFVEIEIPSEDEVTGLVVAEQAIQELGGETVVFVQTGETTFRAQPVVVGESTGGMVPVRRGVTAGDRVVVSGAFALKSELKKGEISHGH